jgi:eukaryotic-like serine/threonine-protein kinase
MKNNDLVSLPSKTLQDRYHIIDLLGEGGSSKTYVAFDEQLQIEVAIKILNLHSMNDWKTLELFNREAKILSQLKHVAIPEYLDYFQASIAGEECFCLVQKIASGRPLNIWVEEGYNFSESELKNVAKQVLDILIYLQTLTPPIIHRDIKPQNIIRSELGVISLVDFGAVRDTYYHTITGGSTIVGTYGYMAPEQFRGQAVLATDLYGLGTTLLYLRSGQDPADLPVKDMKIHFQDRVKTSASFAQWLNRLLEPIPEDRYANAFITKEYLSGNIKIQDPRPKQAITRIYQQDKTMKIEIPPIWLSTRNSRTGFYIAILSSILTLISAWLWLTVYIPTPFIVLVPLLSVFFGLCALPFLTQYISEIAMHQEILITPTYIFYRIKAGKWPIIHIKIRLAQLAAISCEKSNIYALKGGITFHADITLMKIKSEINKLSFSLIFGRYLDSPEQTWLAGEIEGHLQHIENRCCVKII